MKSFNTIIFDLGGTLIDYIGQFASWPELETPGFNAAYKYLQQQGVVVPDPERFRLAGFELLPIRWHQATTGKRNLTVPSLLAETLAAFDVDRPVQSVLDEAADRYQKAICAGAKPISGAREMLSLFQKQGFKLGLISNTMFTGQAHMTDMKRFGLDSYFEALVFSADDDMWKPNNAPFDRVMNLLQVRPGSTIFIGDDPAVDVLGGKRAGLFTIHFRSNDRFRSPDGVTPDATIHELEALAPLIRQLNA